MTHEDLVSKVIHLLEFESAAHEQHKTIFTRLDKLDKIFESISAMNANIALLAQGLTRVEKSISTVREDVDELRAKPGKRWETVVTHILTGVVGALLVFILAKLGIA